MAAVASVYYGNKSLNDYSLWRVWLEVLTVTGVWAAVTGVVELLAGVTGSVKAKSQ